MTERDDAVSRRYRELPAEEPPRALDEAILAASRRAVHAHPAPLVAPAGRQRWYVPLAAAAVIVLAVGLTLRVQLERPEERVEREDATPPRPTVLKDESKASEAPRVEPKAEPKVFAEAKPKAAESDLRDAPEARSREKLAQSNAQGASSSPSPFPDHRAPAGPDSLGETQRMQRAPAEAPAAAAVPPPAPAAKPAPQAPKAAQMRAAPAQRADDAARDNAEHGSAAGALSMKKQAAEETPEKMLERIAELRKNGKHDEADKALAEFRKRFPDYKLSDEMRAKVERPAATPAR